MLRKQLNLTQERLAEKVDLDYRSIGAIERGERGVSLDSLERIAATLDISPDFFCSPLSRKRACL
ncbi:MAG: helix-turn-helix transcriptional regulator [bacterium]|nr:helix-turn-helix transcriptional regulator [bacterium]